MLVGCALDYNRSQHTMSPDRNETLAIEDRTARLTILIDPRKKSVFENLCAEEDATPSQVVRRLIRRYIEERTGEPWTPPANGNGADRTRKRRAGAREAQPGPRAARR